MLAVLIIVAGAAAALVLRSGAPPEPRVIQIAIDPEPAQRSGGAIIALVVAIALMLLLFGGR